MMKGMELVHCLQETTHSVSPNASVFSWFVLSNDAVSSHNTRHWLFFAFWKTQYQDINENYSRFFPKNWRHDLATTLNSLHLPWSQLCLFSPYFWLLLHFRCEVIDRCFINALNRSKNSALILWNIAKHSIEIFSWRWVFFLFWVNATPILRTTVQNTALFTCLPCLQSRVLSVHGDTIAICEFSSVFMELSTTS